MDNFDSNEFLDNLYNEIKDHILKKEKEYSNTIKNTGYDKFGFLLSSYLMSSDISKIIERTDNLNVVKFMIKNYNQIIKNILEEKGITGLDELIS